MKIRFLGGAGAVTGSRCLVRGDGVRVLVDCGMFQGFKQLRLRNWQDLEVPVGSIDAVILTHAHLDHSGWLPALVRRGFSGPVYCTRGTADLLQILLPDSGRIQEEDAAYANKKRFSKHSPAQPLYTEADALDALQRLRPVPWRETVDLGGLRASFHPAGHILGAASVHLTDGEHRLLFSGDLGRTHDLLMPPPSTPPPADFVVVEATYGSRRHPEGDVVGALGEVVRRVAGRGGVLLIPSFAVGRTQSVLRALAVLRERGEIPPGLPVVLDSPMAEDTTELTLRHAADLGLTPAQVAGITQGVRFIRSLDESKALNEVPGPMILVSASGMLTGGRVLHHLARRAPVEANCVLFVGYQAGGTRGARLLAGERRIKVHGTYRNVRCEIARIEGMSGHADRDELVAWLRSLPGAPRQVWVNHGEPEAVDALRIQVAEELGWAVEAAQEGREIDLGAPAAPGPSAAPAAPAHLVTADRDLSFLDRDDMRAVRLLLEYERVEKRLVEQGITATVAVFGSARAPEDGALYAMARRFGRLVGERGGVGGERWAVVTGGGPGVMAAANRGAREGGARSAGFLITLPREQVATPWMDPGLALPFRYFALRKMQFLRRARALVFFVGGFGTLDELTDALCLIQTGKLPAVPVLLVGRAFWSRVLDLGLLVEQGLVDPAHADIARVVEGPEEAWAAIEAWYAAASPGARPPPGP